ncbi:MAG TPA: ABC transporter permease, partial [Methylococcales bacterium]
MKFFDLIITANQSLWRNKARTILTVIAIFIGVTTLSLTNGIGAGIKTYLTKQVGNLGNNSTLMIEAKSPMGKPASQTSGLTKYVPGQKKLSTQTGHPGGLSQVALTQADIKKIQSQPNIVSVEPQYSVTPDYIASPSKPAAKYQFAISQIVGKNNLDMGNGVTVNNEASDYQITIPTSYVSSLGFASNIDAVGKTVTVGASDANGNQGTFNATVTGVQQKTLIGSTSAYANGAFFKALYSYQTTGLPASSKDAYAMLTAVYKDGLSDAQIATLKSKLNAQGYQAQTIKDTVGTVFTVITAVTLVLDGFAAITLLAATFGIVNTLYMSVSERTKEIGLMKALGMGKRKIFLLFSIEAVLIGFWGSMLGIGFATLVGNLVNTIGSKGFLKDFTGLQLLSFTAKSSVTIVLGIMLIAFLAGTL